MEGKGAKLTEGRQSADHEDTEHQSVPQAGETNFAVYATYRCAEGFSGLTVGVELAHHDIGGVGDYGAEDTG